MIAMTMKSPVQTDPSLENIHSILGHLPLFHALNEGQLSRVAAGTSVVRLERGDILFHRGDKAVGFYVVVYGQIKLSISSAQGAQKIVEIISQKQSFGEAVMFLERNYPVSAEALVDSLVLHVAKDKVTALLDSDSLFARAMLAGLSVRLHSLLRDVESYSLRSSMQRVIGYLLQQCSADSEEEIEVALPTSKLVVASRLNLTPETLSRVLHDLVQNELIEVSGRTIRIPSLQKIREFDI